MKKFFGVLAVLAVAAMVSSSVFADKTIVTKKTFTASVSFSTRPVTFNAVLVNASGVELQGTELTWENVTGWEMESPNDQWKQSDQIIKLTKIIDEANTRVWMYQDNNSESIKDSKYYAENGRKNEDESIAYNGLVLGGSKGNNDEYVDGVLNAAHFIPVAYYVSASTNTTNLDFSKAAVDDGYGYRFLVDKSDQNVKENVTKEGYYTIANSDGFVVDLDNTKPGGVSVLSAKNAYVFVGANFHGIHFGKSYGTEKILFDLVTE